MRSPRPVPPSSLAARAARQHGNLHLDDLRDLGLTTDAIRGRTSAGHLLRRHRGVYAVGWVPRHPESAWWAALLAAGEDAVVSHVSAAEVLGYRDRTRSDVHVTTPRDVRSQRGIVGHTSRTLDGSDVTRVDGLRVTAPVRTVLDCAQVLAPRPLVAVVRRAAELGDVDRDQLEAGVRAARGRRGLGEVRRAVDDVFGPGREVLERRLDQLVAEHGFPPAPQRNVVLRGFECDRVWPDHRLAVQLDGYRFHRDRTTFDRDLQRAVELEVALGITVRRLSWTQLDQRPEQVVALLGRFLPRVR